MRIFVWVQFVGSLLAVVVGLAVVGSQKEWPKTITWTAGEWAFKIGLSMGFLIWEVWLLWGPR